MFHTHENGRSSLPTALFNKDEYCWTHVSLDVGMPWFLVTVETIYGAEDSWVSTLFLHNAEQLEELTRRTDRKLIRVQVVQPSEDKRQGWWLKDAVGISKVSTANSEDFIEFDLAKGVAFTSVKDDEIDFKTINILKKTLLWDT